MLSGSNDKLTNVNEAVWLTIVTMTSVGYGELAPQTLGGKLTIVIGAIIGGTIITCLLRVVLIDALLLTPQETVVLDVVDFHAFKRTQKNAAAFLLQQTYKWHRDRCTTARDKSKYKHRVYAAAEAFRLLRFTQPTAAGTASPALRTSDAFSAASPLVAQLDAFEAHASARQRATLHDVQATTQLLRNIAATSRE